MNQIKHHIKHLLMIFSIVLISLFIMNLTAPSKEQASKEQVPSKEQNEQNNDFFELLIVNFTWYPDVNKDPNGWGEPIHTTPIRYPYFSGDPEVGEEQSLERSFYLGKGKVDVYSWWGPGVGDSYDWFWSGSVLNKEGQVTEQFKSSPFCFLYEIWGRLVQEPDGSTFDFDRMYDEQRTNADKFLDDLRLLKSTV